MTKSDVGIIINEVREGEGRPNEDSMMKKEERANNAVSLEQQSAQVRLGNPVPYSPPPTPEGYQVAEHY